MATTITAGNATNGAAISSDNTGILELKTGTGSGTTALTLGTGQQVGYTAGTAAAPSITFTGDTNTGIYSPGANRLGFATDGTQRGEFDASGNFQFNSGYGSVATAYGCRAWVNFNGTGTVAIRASGNVSSITDGGVGVYTVNFTTAMPDVNYAYAFSADDSASNQPIISQNGVQTASALGLRTFNLNVALADFAEVCVSVFR